MSFDLVCDRYRYRIAASHGTARESAGRRDDCRHRCGPDTGRATRRECYREWTRSHGIARRCHGWAIEAELCRSGFTEIEQAHAISGVKAAMVQRSF